MKIIEWNSQGAFRKKNEKILSLNPDILIVPECENEEKLKFGKLTPIPNDFFWYGDSPNKGIGIFSYSDYKFELLKEFNPKFRYIIPLKVMGKNTSFVLFAIWAMDNKENQEARYIGQIWLAINYYSDFLLNEKTILIGDFNSNKIWDYKDRIGNHTDVVNKLKEKRIFSLYHEKMKLEHGNEKHPTFYMYRKKQNPYHIDYCFASNKVLNNNFDFSVGNVDEWIELSDHLPIIVEIEVNVKSNVIVNSLEKGLKNKFEKLLPITKEKFKNLITAILFQAKNSDIENEFLKNEKKRIEIVEDVEKLINIDELLRQMNNKNVG
jgi:exonuclease III